MVCPFPNGHEAAETATWIATRGSKVMTTLQRHADISSLAARTSFSERSRGMKKYLAAAFDDKDDKDKVEDKGEEEKKGMGCFPASASVYVKGLGPVRIDEIQPGDMLLCGDAGAGALLFSKFLGHLHLEATTSADYVSLEMNGGGTVLAVSEEHLVFAASSPEAPAMPMVARELRAGDWVNRVGCDGGLVRAQISEVSKALEDGIYCPLTEFGTVVVNGTLCSCYADALRTVTRPWLQRVATTHQVSHGALMPLRLACRLGFSGPGENKLQGIHPYCRALLSLPVAAQGVV